VTAGRQRPTRRRGLVLLALAAIVTAIPGYAVAADDHALSHAAEMARFRDIVAKVSDTRPGHAHGMAALGASDLAFLGLRPGRGACRGLYEPADAADGSLCTHGLDAPLPDPTAATDRTLAACQPVTDNGCPAPAGWTLPTRMPCYTSGPFVDVLYLYWGTSHFTASKERLRRAVAGIDLLYDISARSTSGTDYVRHVRWRMDASCHLAIKAVQLPANVGTDIFAIKQYLVSRGSMVAGDKYLGFVDTGGCGGGIAEIASDTSAGSSNRSNQGGSLGLSYGCFEAFDPYAGFGATIGAHELMHTLGAVQDTTPHSTHGHCWDDAPSAHLGADIMCYDDGWPGTFVQTCTSTYPETFDCKKDDYYNPAPASGSYLATHWDTARNRYLATAEPAKWDVLAKPTATFAKPSVAGGPIGGDPAAALTIDDRGVGIDRVAWTVNGSPVSSGPDPTLALQTARDRDGGYANGVELTFGATVTDAGGYKTTVSRKGIVANPYVRLVGPSADSGISGPFAWSATAAGASGRTVASVQLLVNGTPVGSPDTTAPYGGTYDPKLSASDGEVILMLAARVKDSAGVTRDTPDRAVTRVAPVVTWRSPTEYADEFFPFPAQTGTTARFRVDAETSAAGGVNRVLFKVDGTTVSTDYGAPYTFDYLVPTAGQTHRITARAVDANGVYSTTQDLWISANAAHAATSFTQPAGDGQTLSGTATFGLSGASGYDQVCLVIDTAYPGCLDPSSQTSIDVDLSTFTPGVHAAHWQLGWYDAGSEFHEIRGPSRTFVIGGPSPSIAITQLSPGLKVSGKKTVGAIVSGLPAGVSIYEVDFFAGTALLGGDWSPAYYLTWDTKTTSDGPHRVRAVALLSDGSRIGASVDVVTSNFSGKLTAPIAGSTVSGTVTLAATATADAETVAEAATFLLDGVVIARDRSAPFSVAWDSHAATDGSHGLTVKIQLNDGRTATTPAQTITVDNVP
jgi:hypothetical protein